MRLKGSYFVVLLIVGLLAGGTGTAAAATGGKLSVPGTGSLLGNKYESVRLVGTPVAKGQKVTISFFRHESKPFVSFQAGCNAWGSRFKIRKGRLFRVGSASGTDVGCSRDPDPWLQRKLRKSFLIRAGGKRLVLARPAEGIRLVFNRVADKTRGINEPDPDYEIPVGEPATVETLEGKSFKSVKVIGQQVDDPIELTFEKGRLGAYLGCNRMSGGYQIGLSREDWLKDGILRWFNVLTTDMACQLSDDSWFSGLLDKGVEATVNDSWLVLARGGTTIVLKQVAISDPPERVPAGAPSTIESLDGRSFESVSVIGRRLVKPIEISFFTGKVNRFDDEGKQVTGNGLGAYLGCNWMSGEYSIEGGELSWVDVISTLIGCYAGGNQRDTWFSDLLRQGVEVSESEDGLIFDRGSTQIVFKEIQD